MTDIHNHVNTFIHTYIELNITKKKLLGNFSNTMTVL